MINFAWTQIELSGHSAKILVTIDAIIVFDFSLLKLSSDILSMQISVCPDKQCFYPEMSCYFAR